MLPRQGNPKIAYGGLMNRMLTLIWALGVVAFTSQAQAVAPMGDEINSVGVTGKTRRAELAHLSHDYTTSSSYKPRRAGKTTTQHAHKVKQRKKAIYAYRSRRITSDSTSSNQKTKVAKAASRKRARTARSVPVGMKQAGMASYYWQGQRVASGGWFNPRAMTAAHKTLPFGTRVRVTNKRNGKSVEVTINDRGPYVGGRIIDLSDAAASAIGMKKAGIVPVEVEVVGR